MDVAVYQNFLNVYGRCFNPDGTVKNCGRECTKQLIDVAGRICPSGNYGNLANGMMNIPNISSLYNKIVACV